MTCFYILMSVMRIDRWIGIIGAIAYAFIYNAVLVGAGHETKVFAISYLPAVIAGLVLIYRGKWLAGAALQGIALALMVGSNHFQVMYYTLFLILFYVVGKFIITLRNKENVGKFFISSGIAALVAAFAVGSSMGYILTTKEYAKTTMRGGESELTINHDADKKAGGLDKDYAFQWSSGIGESLTMMIPYLYGGSSGEPSEKAPAAKKTNVQREPSDPRTDIKGTGDGLKHSQVIIPCSPRQDQCSIPGQTHLAAMCVAGQNDVELVRGQFVRPFGVVNEHNVLCSRIGELFFRE